MGRNGVGRQVKWSEAGWFDIINLSIYTNYIIGTHYKTLPQFSQTLSIHFTKPSSSLIALRHLASPPTLAIQSSSSPGTSLLSRHLKSLPRS
jgi:hypothetical protein